VFTTSRAKTIRHPRHAGSPTSRRKAQPAYLIALAPWRTAGAQRRIILLPAFRRSRSLVSERGVAVLTRFSQQRRQLAAPLSPNGLGVSPSESSRPALASLWPARSADRLGRNDRAQGGVVRRVHFQRRAELSWPPCRLFARTSSLYPSRMEIRVWAILSPTFLCMIPIPGPLRGVRALKRPCDTWTTQHYAETSRSPAWQLPPPPHVLSVRTPRGVSCFAVGRPNSRKKNMRQRPQMGAKKSPLRRRDFVGLAHPHPRPTIPISCRRPTGIVHADRSRDSCRGHHRHHRPRAKFVVELDRAAAI